MGNAVLRGETQQTGCSELCTSPVLENKAETKRCLLPQGCGACPKEPTLASALAMPVQPQMLLPLAVPVCCF